MRNKQFAMSKEQLTMKNEQNSALGSLNLRGLRSGILALVAFIFCLVFAGCDNGFGFKDDNQVQSGYGRVSVKASMGALKNSAFPAGARTAIPNVADNAFTRYIYTFTPTGSGDPIVVGRTASQTGDFTLPLGNYKVTVQAYDAASASDDDPAATGVSGEFQVKGSNPSLVTVPLVPVTGSGTGTLDYAISSPAGTTLTIKLFKDGITDVSNKITYSGVSASGEITLDAGFYLFTVTANDSVHTAGKVEVVHIYRSFKTECNISITQADLIAPAHKISVSEGSVKDFGELSFHHPNIPAHEVTITNRGKETTSNLSVTLDDATGFELVKTSVIDIVSSGETTFTITPKTGLNAGTYTGTVTVADDYVSVEFTVRFQVNPISDNLDIDAIAPQIYTGSALTPSVTVKYYGAVLASTNYDVEYSNNTAATIFNVEQGEEIAYANVTVTGKGNYVGSSGSKTFEIHRYAIGLSHTGTHNETDYPSYTNTDKTVSVTVTNNGNVDTGELTIAKTGSNANDFNLSTTTLSNVTTTGTFTVTPVSGLGVGVYTATITVSGTHITSVHFDYVFTVTASPLYDINVDSSDGGELTATYGYNNEEHEFTITVENAGNQATGGLTIALSNTTNFELVDNDGTLSSLTVSGPGSSTSFTVRPKADLNANVAAYTTTVTVSGGNGITDTTNLSFTVGAKSINFEIDTINAVTFNRTAQEPAISFVNAEATALTKGDDYTVEYSNNTNAGSGLVEVTGKGNYAGTAQKNFTINPKTIDFVIVPSTIADQDYDEGNPIHPAITSVSDGDFPLTAGEDYEVEYISSGDDGEGNNTYEEGDEITIRITGKGNYTGTDESLTFTIVSQ